MRDQDKSYVDRRSFIRNLAVGGVAVAAAGELIACGGEEDTPTPSPTPIPAQLVDWDEETEVLIIGAGGAGMAAAIEAHNAGAAVLLLEKADVSGGTTSLSGGVVQASETDIQAAAGIPDTHDKHYEFWRQAGEGIPDNDLIRLLADKSKEGLQFLADLGQVYTYAYEVEPIPYVDDDVRLARIHVSEGRGAGQAAVLRAEVDRLGLEVRFNARVTDLVRDADEGIVGVKVEIDGTPLYIKATRAVVVASGGFDHNKELAREFSPQQLWELETGTCACNPHNTGDGMVMGMAAGAALAGLGGTVGYPAVPIGRAGDPALPGIWVNKQGQRFCNEAGHYAFVVRAVYDQVEHLAWAIFDEHVRALGGEDLINAAAASGATLEELAGKLGVNAHQLGRTVAQWNTDVGAGADPVFDKKVGLTALDQGPFYATQVVSWNLGSCGGLKINTDTQVIDLGGEPIPRLFAAGMAAGGYIGPYYPGSGTALCATVVLGRIAGVNAAAMSPFE